LARYTFDEIADGNQRWALLLQLHCSGNGAFPKPSILELHQPALSRALQHARAEALLGSQFPPHGFD
jgi:hypothetical protein